MFARTEEKKKIINRKLQCQSLGKEHELLELESMTKTNIHDVIGD